MPSLQTVIFVAVVVCIQLVAFWLVLKFGSSQEGIEELGENLDQLTKDKQNIENAVREEIAKHREETGNNARQDRKELAETLRAMTESVLNRQVETANLQKSQLDTFSKTLTDKFNTLTQDTRQRLEDINKTVSQQLTKISEDTNQKLEQMRITVDEKLQSTLEKRMRESFQLVSSRLEEVHKGLGDMRRIASSVGDLKNVLTNVKARGMWGEIQLENLLEDVLALEQYEKNVAIKKGSSERVEFAIKIPSKHDNDKYVLLPVDAKFPLEDYQRLILAQEKSDTELYEKSVKQLEVNLKKEAKKIREKYVDPPNTTDFGIMFLPSEGLYAEVLRRPGLTQSIQTQFSVIVTGPSNFCAFLNSLQMGFRTLAIEKRSSQVWETLAMVKKEFENFGGIIAKTQKKLQEATNTLDTVGVRTRKINRCLKDVQSLPSTDSNGTNTPLLENTADPEEQD